MNDAEAGGLLGDYGDVAGTGDGVGHAGVEAAGGEEADVSSGGSGGSNAGGSSTGGASAGSGGNGGGGSGCACPKTLTWADNTVLNWASGDCLDVSGTKYLYTGAKAQTYANGQCNPTKQEAWCTDSGNDYKFMACK